MEEIQHIPTAPSLNIVNLSVSSVYFQLSKRTLNIKRMTKYQQSGYNHEWQKEYNLPYLATKPETSLNHNLYSSPFSEPWQRYSKPKFQESIDQ